MLISPRESINVRVSRRAALSSCGGFSWGLCGSAVHQSTSGHLYGTPKPERHAALTDRAGTLAPVSPAADEPTSSTADGLPLSGEAGSASAAPDLWTDVGADDRDEGWGERTELSSGLGDDWYLRERPPHHG